MRNNVQRQGYRPRKFITPNFSAPDAQAVKLENSMNYTWYAQSKNRFLCTGLKAPKNKATIDQFSAFNTSSKRPYMMLKKCGKTPDLEFWQYLERFPNELCFYWWFAQASKQPQYIHHMARLSHLPSALALKNIPTNSTRISTKLWLGRLGNISKVFVWRTLANSLYNRQMRRFSEQYVKHPSWLNHEAKFVVSASLLWAFPFRMQNEARCLLDHSVKKWEGNGTLFYSLLFSTLWLERDFRQDSGGSLSSQGTRWHFLSKWDATSLKLVKHAFLSHNHNLPGDRGMRPCVDLPWNVQ